MIDYRNNPEDSPVAWCVQCRELVVVQPATKLMKTVFRVEPSGVYPFCNCPEHARQTTAGSVPVSIA
ncbi:hypothetical protein LLE49_23265 [Alicyclobacillus tolerans]|uniref:hypothetical protein n=1 Tax=Alicyclobacillus tolerans TaxID=90970 RepID=UPI001F451B5A|nr:hypothetical protein [Alicyclobacillus tolerans]MCF8567643.1 hypothetical protein [Alicyclobacillus tolerans]